MKMRIDPDRKKDYLHNMIEYLKEEYKEHESNRLKPKDIMDKEIEILDRQYEEDYHRILSETETKLHDVVSKVKEAISRIELWNDSNVTIIPMFNQDNAYEAGNTVHVYVHHGNNFRNSPDFTLFDTGEIDDVLESGDEDFFDSVEVQMDYFNLIKEIRKPGSSSSGKSMNLYTARPVKDRKIYIDAKKVPAGIFLANSYDHVEGLAKDLAGGDKVRDIYKIRINEKYLMKTLDTGSIKEYQVVGKDSVPVEKCELISEGE
jgi:hypothetical protein